MSQSTPLEQIVNDDAGSTPSDAMRVQRILQEINGGGDESPGQQQQPQQQQQQPMYQEQMQQQAASYHMYQPPHPPPQLMGPGMQPYPQERMPPQYQQQRQEQEQEPAPVAPSAPAKKNVWAHITDALKLPFVVAFVFFILSLPLVDVYLSKYAHWAFSSGGQLSLYGIALKAVAAGAIMGIYDTVDSFVSRFF